MYFIDINGDSLSVNKSVMQDKLLSTAFKQFMGTKEGMKFLSQYAAKGQTIFGHTFNKDGALSKKGVDLVYTAQDKGSRGANADTDADYKEGGRVGITVTLNNNAQELGLDGKTLLTGNDLLFNNIKTIFHESFIHVDQDSKDFLDNRRLDNSHISSAAKKDAGGQAWHYDHSQMRMDYLQYGYSRGLWPGEAYKGLNTINLKLKTNYSPQKIVDIMWNFAGSN